MVFPNGDVYEGEYFTAEQKSGDGTYSWKSGEKYEGEWENDQMDGEGKYTKGDKIELSGTFEKSALKSGSCKVKNEFGEYTLTIKDGKASKIEAKMADGTTYKGNMKDNQFTGKATIQYGNGDTYDGNMVNGQKSGSGKYSWKSGASYDGEWKEDRMSGKGIYYYSTKDSGHKLEGTFANGAPNGECEYYENSSTHYKTDWMNGKCVKIYE